MTRASAAFVVAFGALLAGCSSWVATSAAVYGPYRETPERDLFEQVGERVRSRGYRLLDADAQAGHFAVRSQTAHRTLGRAAFRFRFYRGGWVAVEVVGGGARRTCDGQLLLPPPLHREYAALVDRLLVPASEDGP